MTEQQTTDPVSVDPETETLRVACPACDWTLETAWADTILHRRMIERALETHTRTTAHAGGK